MADIFISYSSTDKTVVKRIARLLETKGWSVWWDREIPVGQQYDTVIETELQKASCVLVVWTQRSIASEWVKNEASEAAAKGKLVPVLLENVAIPLAFKRTEAALLTDWDGEADHPELEKLFASISQILAQNPTGAAPRSPTPAIEKGKLRRQQLLAASGGIVAIAAALALYLQQQNGLSRPMAIGLLIITGLGIAVCFMGLVQVRALKQQLKPSPLLRMAAPFAGLLGILVGGLLLANSPAERNLAIRLFDWKKNPITQGDVKIYLPEYVRTQSIDKVGQALFTGIPAGTFKQKMKIEVSSPGYASKVFDTQLLSSKPLELTLPLTTVVLISGKIKTAAEIPIKGVEVSVDGTRYYAISITDGTYNLRLQEYTLGDEVSITTSHKDYEDKTINLRITSPNLQNQDIFLNPIVH